MVTALYVVVLLGIVVVVLVRPGSAFCKIDEFRCGTKTYNQIEAFFQWEKCIPIQEWCNGDRDCGDGSDERYCRAFGTFMRYGDILAVHVQYREEHNAVEFLMCDSTECSRLWTAQAALRPSGALAYRAMTRCNKLGRHCGNTIKSEIGYSFTSGSLVFMVKRRASEFAVWLQGHPDKAVAVPVAEGQNTLRIRPDFWRSDMSVRITDHALLCGEEDDLFRCDARKCIPIWLKCDGVADCDNGIDEVSCDAFNTTINVGEGVTAYVQYRKKHSAIQFLMCDLDDTVCSSLWTLQASSPANGSLVHGTRTGCNRLGRRCLTTIKSGHGHTFTPAVVVFEVKRRASDLAVWLQGHPDKMVTVPVPWGYKRLKIRPSYWGSDMPVRISGRCACTRGYPYPIYQADGRLPDGSGCFAIKAGAVVKVKPPERMTEKRQCSSKVMMCEVYMGYTKQFGTEYSNATSPVNSQSAGAAVRGRAFGGALGAEVEATVSSHLTFAMMQTQSHGWAELTAAASSFSCQVPPGHTGWVEIRPEFYVKEGTVFNADCSSSSLAKWFPKTRGDGSIAGERRCVVQETTSRESLNHNFWGALLDLFL